MTHTRTLTFAIVLTLFVAGCSSADDASSTTSTADGATGSTTTVAPDPPSDPTFIVTDGDTVDVHYVGTLDDGSQFDSSRDRGVPLTFTVGADQVLPGFDAAVRGGSVGDVTTVRIEPEDAYGEWTEDNVIEVPFNPEQGDIAVGDEVYLTNGQPAIILDITDETVTLDANHRLVGKALTFEIEILTVTRG